MNNRSAPMETLEQFSRPPNCRTLPRYALSLGQRVFVVEWMEVARAYAAMPAIMLQDWQPSAQQIFIRLGREALDRDGTAFRGGRARANSST